MKNLLVSYMNNYYKKINFTYNHKILLDIANKYLDRATVGYTDINGKQVSYDDFDGKEKAKFVRNVDGTVRLVPYKDEVYRGSTTPPKTIFFKDMPEDFRHLDVFKDLCVLFRNTNTVNKHHDLNHLYNYAQFFRVSGPLKPHKDMRTCAFTVPLYGAVDPVYWYDEDDKELMRYNYDGPTLINTSIRHGCMDNTGERVFFQIGGFAEPFNELQKVL
jgi:hypothetical protein